MSRTKYDFMQDMLIRARNRHRRELGLCPESPEVAALAAMWPPEPDSSTDGHPEPFDGKIANPMPLGGK